MEQHPIPQQISSYQFRLVGDMTLKQFFQLAGGVLVGLLFYSSPLLPIIKWPFAIVSVILGVALAFLPFEERPLEKWIFAFFKAIYTPTIYQWRVSETPKVYFQNETTPSAQVTPMPQLSGPLKKLEEEEKGFLARLAGLFSGFAPQAPKETPQAEPAPVVQPQPQLNIPQAQPIKIVAETKPRLIVEERVPEEAGAPQIQTSQVSGLAGEELISTKGALFSLQAAPPNPPIAPNLVVGQVVDEEGKIIEAAIMEIKDTAGRPVRALKSNKVGHFIIVTPLERGKYEIVTEKEGLEFQPVSFEANGTIIPPILIQGKSIQS